MRGKAKKDNWGGGSSNAAYFPASGDGGVFSGDCRNSDGRIPPAQLSSAEERDTLQSASHRTVDPAPTTPTNNPFQRQRANLTSSPASPLQSLQGKKYSQQTKESPMRPRFQLDQGSLPGKSPFYQPRERQPSQSLLPATPTYCHPHERQPDQSPRSASSPYHQPREQAPVPVLEWRNRMEAEQRPALQASPRGLAEQERMDRALGLNERAVQSPAQRSWTPAPPPFFKLRDTPIDYGRGNRGPRYPDGQRADQTSQHSGGLATHAPNRPDGYRGQHIAPTLTSAQRVYYARRNDKDQRDNDDSQRGRGEYDQVVPGGQLMRIAERYPTPSPRGGVQHCHPSTREPSMPTPTLTHTSKSNGTAPSSAPAEVALGQSPRPSLTIETRLEQGRFVPSTQAQMDAEFREPPSPALRKDASQQQQLAFQTPGTSTGGEGKQKVAEEQVNEPEEYKQQDDTTVAVRSAASTSVVVPPVPPTAADDDGTVWVSQPKKRRQRFSSQSPSTPSEFTPSNHDPDSDEELPRHRARGGPNRAKDPTGPIMLNIRDLSSKLKSLQRSGSTSAAVETSLIGTGAPRRDDDAVKQGPGPAAGEPGAVAPTDSAREPAAEQMPQAATVASPIDDLLLELATPTPQAENDDRADPYESQDINVPAADPVPKPNEAPSSAQSDAQSEANTSLAHSTQSESPDGKEFPNENTEQHLPGAIDADMARENMEDTDDREATIPASLSPGTHADDALKKPTEETEAAKTESNDEPENKATAAEKRIDLRLTPAVKFANDFELTPDAEGTQQASSVDRGLLTPPPSAALEPSKQYADDIAQVNQPETVPQSAAAATSSVQAVSPPQEALKINHGTHALLVSPHAPDADAEATPATQAPLVTATEAPASSTAPQALPAVAAVAGPTPQLAEADDSGPSQKRKDPPTPDTLTAATPWALHKKTRVAARVFNQALGAFRAHATDEQKVMIGELAQEFEALYD